MAGETLDGAIAAVRSLNANGISAGLDLLGESVNDERQAESARDEVISVLSSARRHGIFFRIDMEGSTCTGRTLRLFSERLHPEFGDFTAVVIQSYMRRSAEDVDELIEMQARAPHRTW